MPRFSLYKYSIYINIYCVAHRDTGLSIDYCMATFYAQGPPNPRTLRAAPPLRLSCRGSPGLPGEKYPSGRVGGAGPATRSGKG